MSKTTGPLPHHVIPRDDVYACAACQGTHPIDADCPLLTPAARLVGAERNSPMVELEARAGVAEAILAVKGDHNDVTAVLGKVDPADLAPRFIPVPKEPTPPVITNAEAAMREMSRFDNTPGDPPSIGLGQDPAVQHDHVHYYPCTRGCPAFEPDFKVGDTWHRAGCDGNCPIAFGCAAQWHPEEVAAMKAAATAPAPINRVPAERRHGTCTPVLRDKTSAERKAEPIHSGVLMYFPDALAAVARLSKAGNDKHNPGEPLHWARGKSMDQMDCLVRHSLTRDWTDQETQEIEAVAMAWRALAELQLLEEKRLVAAGIRPYSGVVPA